MNARVVTSLVLALALIGVVMSVTGAITFTGLANTSRYTSQQVWRQPLAAANSMKIIDLTGDGQNELFAQADHIIAVYDATGSQIFTDSFNRGMASTMGDVNGDGVEDIVVFDATGVFVLSGSGELMLRGEPEDVDGPFRVAVIRFDGGRQVVLGDEAGLVVALDAGSGRERWRATTTRTDYIRGLDDARIDGVLYLAVANHSGMVKLFDENGEALWTYNLSGYLRRMRSYDLDGDGTSELLLGGDGNRLVMLDAATGQERINIALGQTITEIREVEIDGDPSSREFVVGGKDGGVWAFSASGEKLWSATRDDRVNEIAGLDIDDDGQQEIVIGYESGRVDVFAGRLGQRQLLGNWEGPVSRIDAGRLSGSDQIVVADRDALHLLTMRKVRAPIVYSPLVAGLLVSVVIVFAAGFIATLPQKPVLRLSAEDKSVEGLLTRHRMLHESLADVERMRGNQDMPAGAYIARLRDLRGELADTQAALIALGQPVRVETFKCPNCGGALPLGLDKCEYCGQVVIV